MIFTMGVFIPALVDVGDPPLIYEFLPPLVGCLWKEKFFNQFRFSFHINCEVEVPVEDAAFSITGEQVAHREFRHEEVFIGSHRCQLGSSIQLDLFIIVREDMVGIDHHCEIGDKQNRAGEGQQ